MLIAALSGIVLMGTNLAPPLWQLWIPIFFLAGFPGAAVLGVHDFLQGSAGSPSRIGSWLALLLFVVAVALGVLVLQGESLEIVVLWLSLLIASGITPLTAILASVIAAPKSEEPQ